MCTVSMIADHYRDEWTKRLWFQQAQQSIEKETPKHWVFEKSISRAEFEALKKEVEDVKKLLLKAKEYDEKNNEPNCEMEEKVDLLKKIAQLVGVDLTEVFNKSRS